MVLFLGACPQVHFCYLVQREGIDVSWAQAVSKGSRDANLKGCLLYAAIATLVGKSLALVNFLAVLN